jgi:hypothetical protein
MASTSYSTSPLIRSGGGLVKLGPWAFILIYGVRRLLWKTGWMFHDTGRSNCKATGDISFVMVNGPYCFGESLIVPWEMGRFFPSSQTCCPWAYLLESGVCAEVALFRARMAIRRFFWNFAT